MTVSPAALLALTGLALLSAWRVLGERETEGSAAAGHQALLAALAVTGSLATILALAWTPLLAELAPGDQTWIGAAALLGFVLPVGGGLTYAVRRSALAGRIEPDAPVEARRDAPSATDAPSHTGAGAGAGADVDRERSAGAPEEAAASSSGPSNDGPDEVATPEVDAPTSLAADRVTPVLAVPEPDPLAYVDGEAVPVDTAYARAAELLGGSCAIALSGHASAHNNARLAALSIARGWEPFVVPGGPHDEDAEAASGGNAGHEQELALMIAGGALQGVVFLDARGEFSPLVVNSLSGMGSICLFRAGTPVSQASRVQLRFETEADRATHIRGIARALEVELPSFPDEDTASTEAEPEPEPDASWTRPLRAGRPATRQRLDPRDPRPHRANRRRTRR